MAATAKAPNSHTTGPTRAKQISTLTPGEGTNGERDMGRSPREADSE
jgi:hypothetical protein